jgi:hypothetical protein
VGSHNVYDFAMVCSTCQKNWGLLFAHAIIRKEIIEHFYGAQSNESIVWLNVLSSFQNVKGKKKKKGPSVKEGGQLDNYGDAYLDEYEDFL